MTTIYDLGLDRKVGTPCMSLTQLEFLQKDIIEDFVKVMMMNNRRS